MLGALAVPSFGAPFSRIATKYRFGLLYTGKILIMDLGLELVDRQCQETRSEFGMCRYNSTFTISYPINLCSAVTKLFGA